MTNYKSEISKEELSELPMIAFEGEIICVDKEEDIKDAVEYLKQFEILGFDTETKPSFKKGVSNNVCLLQLSTEERAYLFRLHIIGFTEEIMSLLEADDIRKVGVGVHEDIVGLNKLRKFKHKNFFELQTFAKSFGIENISLKKLCGIVLDSTISKRQQVSNWEKEDLTPAQQKYAATDAWTSLKIHDTLRTNYYLN